MDLEGAFFDFEGALLHSLPKSGGAMAPLPPPGFLRPCEPPLIKDDTSVH